MEKISSKNTKNGSDKITLRINIVRLWQITAVCAIVLAVIFCALWINAKNAAYKEAEEIKILTAEIEGAPQETLSAQTQSVSETAAQVKDYNVDGVSINGKRIIIDPGHGGDVPGGTTGVSGKKEKEVNLEISLKLKEILENQGAQVIMTRETDTALGTTWEEDMKARENIILSSNPDMFLSIHQNEFKDDPTASGPQVFFVKQGSVGKRLAVCVQDMLNFELEIESPRIPLEAAYRVLKPGTQPSCTVECGFMSNPDEEALLKDPEYQSKIAQAISDGIKLYVKKFG